MNYCVICAAVINSCLTELSAPFLSHYWDANNEPELINTSWLDRHHPTYCLSNSISSMYSNTSFLGGTIMASRLHNASDKVTTQNWTLWESVMPICGWLWILTDLDMKIQFDFSCINLIIHGVLMHLGNLFSIFQHLLANHYFDLIWIGFLGSTVQNLKTAFLKCFWQWP